MKNTGTRRSTTTRGRQTKRQTTRARSTTKQSGLYREIVGLLLVLSGLLALLGYTSWIGVVGEFFAYIPEQLFGILYGIPTLLVMYVGLGLLLKDPKKKDPILKPSAKWLWYLLLFLSVLSLISFIMQDVTTPVSMTDESYRISHGGLIGGGIAELLYSVGKRLGGLIINIFAFLIFLSLSLKISLGRGIRKVGERTKGPAKQLGNVVVDKSVQAAQATTDYLSTISLPKSEGKLFDRAKDFSGSEVVSKEDSVGQWMSKSARNTISEAEAVAFDPALASEVAVEHEGSIDDQTGLGEDTCNDSSSSESTTMERSGLNFTSYAGQRSLEEDGKDSPADDAYNASYDDFSYSEGQAYRSSYTSFSPDEVNGHGYAAGFGTAHTEEYMGDDRDLQEEETADVPQAEDEPVDSMTQSWSKAVAEDYGNLRDVEDSATSTFLPVGENGATTNTLKAGESCPMLNTLNTDEDTQAVAVNTEGDDLPSGRKGLGLRYEFPSLTMLSKGEDSVVDQSEVAEKSALLEQTLSSFKINSKVVSATRGPTVTRYEMDLPPGVKVSRILNLADNIQLALAAADIRMEAPIPGKSLVGIEVPNSKVSAVHLRDVLDCPDFKNAKGGVPVGLGKDISGKPIITDLTKMPHLLVAGSTGSGKSVCINTLISSILFSRKPDEVKLILIDPKKVELSTYDKVPHLMVPVVTDMKKAASVLRWAVREMESRYRSFADTGCKNIEGYNAQFPDKTFPYIVLIIDELADLMMTAPDDIEDSICRLAQMARAAGIHMVLATQRPSVNVITGTIKANVPSRISFAVATQIDSRTILDMGGAEKLLGKGDMLFNPIGANKPVRIQGAFIGDREVEELVDFVKGQAAQKFDESAQEALKDEPEPVEEESKTIRQDEFLEKAVNVAFDYGASTSMLQRRIHVGYSRAGSLIDAMEELKILGPANGSKPRELLMTKEEALALVNRQGN